MAKFGNRRRGDEEGSEPEESSAIPMGPASEPKEFFVEPDVDDDEEEVVEISDEDMTPEEAARASEKERLAAADALKKWMDEEGVYIRNREILDRLHKDIRANRKMNE